MKPTNAYSANNGRLFATENEAIAEDCKDELLDAMKLRNRIYHTPLGCIRII